MKPKLLLGFAFLLVMVLLLYSCKKEFSCEACREANQPPVANAGADQTIQLPKDSVLLDGSASTDPDGSIKQWQWTKLSGPVSFTLTSATSPKTTAKNLQGGVYRFELKVTDDKGLSAKDTVQVMVDDATVNQPPLACAGSDKAITLPTTMVTLNGTCSTDPENNITVYNWTKVAGPASFNIANANAAQTQVNNLTEGVYRFELRVIDAGGLSSNDTVQIVVNAVAATQCGGNRTLVPAQVVSVGALSQARWHMAVASAGGKILFAGGYSAMEPNGSSRVDIYDIATNTWSTTELSQPRYDITAIAAGTKILFAGGGYGTHLPGGTQNSVGKTVVDVYDASTNTWLVTALSEVRSSICAATVGDKVFFAGGNNAIGDAVNKVDIYNTSTHTWSTASLSVPRAGISAVTLNNKIYFAGGYYYPPSPADTNFTVLNNIDVYDNNTNSWSTALLNEPQSEMAGIAMGGKIIWAGGYAGIGGNPSYPGFTCKVQITDATLQNYSAGNLSCPTYVRALPKENKIVYISWSVNLCNATKFDIYEPSTNSWSMGVLPLYREGATVISVNNEVYLAGGFINNGYSNLNNLSNQVYKVIF